MKIIVINNTNNQSRTLSHRWTSVSTTGSNVRWSCSDVELVSRGSCCFDGISELIFSLHHSHTHTHACTRTDTRVWYYLHSLDDASAARTKHTHQGACSRRLANQKVSALNKVHFPACGLRPGSGWVSCLCALGWGEGVFWTLWWLCMWARLCF